MLSVYLITNKINNKKYVGITAKTLEERFAGHINTAYNRHDERYRPIHWAIRKYGKENFTIELLDNTSTTHEELYQKEKEFIIKYDTFGKNGYNVTHGGEGTHGYKFRESSKMAIRNSLNEHYRFHPETKEKISNSLKGRKLPQQQIDQLKIILKGNQRAKGMTYKHTDEARKKISEYQRNKPSLPCPEHVKELTRKRMLGPKNPMNDPEKRKLVGLSKIGKKKFKREDGTYYMAYPNNPIDPRNK